MRNTLNKWLLVTVLIAMIPALSACQGGLDNQAPTPCEVGLYAGGASTRTEMLPNGLSAVWSAGDELAVWAKNSVGEYTLSNQIFRTYGLDSGRGFFSSTLDGAMPEGTYTYYSTYPVPVSVNGTAVTFELPAQQDGKVRGGADIMISDPVQHGALTALPNPEDHSGMQMHMNRMMHQFRFYIPEENTVIGEEQIEQLFLTFPSDVAGKVTLDVADLTAVPQLTESTSSMKLVLDQPIGISRDELQYACLAIAPKQFAEGESIQLKAYTYDKIALFDPIDLCARNFQAGHSTPVMLNVRELIDFAGMITFTVAANNLGEDPNVITLTAPAGCNFGDGGTNVYRYDPGRKIQVGEKIVFRFETDVDAYMAFSGQQISVSYDSDNALMSETVTMPSITQHGKTEAALTVPYLLFEDFSCVYAEGESYGNNSYSSSEREQPGSSLDGCMSHTGWNAARYWTTGNSIRINTRYQCVSVSLLGYKLTYASSHHGRLDTPQLSGLKPGKTVNLKMTFDAGGYLHKSSTASVSDVALCIASHGNAGVLDGIPTGATGINSNYETSLNDFGTRQDSHAMSSNFGENDFNATFPTYESVISKATSSTRLVFYTIFSGSESFACNAEFNVYIDNIKVQIK